MSPRLAAMAAAAAAVVPCANAAEWRVAPAVSTSVVNESNPRFVVDSTGEQQAIAADFAVRLDMMSETTNLGLNAAADRRQYKGDQSLNRSDLRADLSVQHAASERLSWSAVAAATRDTTLTSELGTSGETRIGHRHESVSAQLQPSWQVSERLSVELPLQWQSDNYPSMESSLVDYQYRSAGLSSLWRVSSQDQIGLVGRIGELRVEEATANIRDASAQLQYVRTMNERWRLTLAAGPEWVRGNGATQHGESFSLEVTRIEHNGANYLTIDRRIAPTGRGYLTRRDSVSLQLLRDLSEHVSGIAGARYLRSRNVIGALGFTFDDVRYRRLEAGLSWHLAPQWSADFRAGYSDQKQSAIGTNATGVDLGLGIHWNGKNHVF